MIFFGNKKILKIFFFLSCFAICSRILYTECLKEKLTYFFYNHPLGAKILSILPRKVKHSYVRGPYILTLYQTMKDVHDVMEVTGIKYWADYGTLLGACRHKGIIPWDDDCDITVSAQDSSLFMQKAVPLLQKLGYKIQRESKFMIKVSSTSSMIKLKPDELYPACDVFFAEETKETFQVPLDVCGDAKPLYKKDLYPLKRYDFGSIKVWGPANPTPYLNDYFGKNWSIIACKGDDHQFKDHREASRKLFAIKKDQFAPAQPIGPLKDNRLLMREIYAKKSS